LFVRIIRTHGVSIDTELLKYFWYSYRNATNFNYVQKGLSYLVFETFRAAVCIYNLECISSRKSKSFFNGRCLQSRFPMWHKKIAGILREKYHFEITMLQSHLLNLCKGFARRTHLPCYKII